MPNRIRATDSGNVFPALQRRPRSLSRPVRALLLAYGLCLLLTFAGLFWLTLEVRREAEARARLISAEIEQRSAARDAERQASNARLREAVCGLLVDLGRVPELAGAQNVEGLATQFDCP